jgi:hypothetical protein
VAILKNMKDINPKSQNKSAKKTAANHIEASLLATLKDVATKFGQNAKHFEKEIEKGAKKLAKKLSKEMEFVKPAAPKKDIVIKPAAEKPKAIAKSPVKAAAPAEVKANAPVVVKPAVKKAEPAKPAPAAAKTGKKPVVKAKN